MKALCVTVLMALWAAGGSGAAQGERWRPRGLFSVTLKVPFSTVFMIPALSCRDKQTEKGKEGVENTIVILDKADENDSGTGTNYYSTRIKQ